VNVDPVAETLVRDQRDMPLGRTGVAGDRPTDDRSAVIWDV